MNTPVTLDVLEELTDIVVLKQEVPDLRIPLGRDTLHFGGVLDPWVLRIKQQ